MNKVIENIILFIVLVLVQAIICNHVVLFNVALPIIFIYFLFRQSINLSVNLMMTLGFFIGLSVDIFSDTLGVNALSCTILASIRNKVIMLYIPHEDELHNPIPSVQNFGLPLYAKYSISMTFIYCVLFFIIESFSFINFRLLILRIIFSTVLSFIIILGIDSLSNPKREKRLYS